MNQRVNRVAPAACRRGLRAVALLFWVCLGTACNDKGAERKAGASVEPEPPKDVARVGATSTTRPLAEATNEMLDSLRAIAYTGNADLDYVLIQKEHQQAALEMYETLLTRGKNEELRAIGQQIIIQLKEELRFWNEIAISPGGGAAPSPFSERALGLLDSLTAGGLSMHGAYLDLDFATMMIQQNSNAEALAKLYLPYGKDARLLAFSRKLIASYRKDAEQLQRWKRKYYPSAG